MGDDTFCVFIIVVGLIAIVMPGAGDVIIGLFGFALAAAALLFPSESTKDHKAPPHRYHAAG